MKLRTRRPWDAVVGPENLLTFFPPDGIKRAFSCMIGCKGDVILGMPILRGYDAPKSPAQMIDNGNNPVAIWHRQAPPWAKIDLNIDD
jgi:hypothetical protein